ncbi:MAG: ABC transporter permease [Blautia sp.]
MDGYQQQTGILEDVQGRMEEEVEGQTPQAAQKIAAENAKVLEDLVDQVRSGEREEYVKEVSLGGREVSSVAPYYFALVAMGCLYMCFWGDSSRGTQQTSEIGKRISVSPAHRLKVIVSNGVSAYVIALVNITVLMLFLTEGIKGIDIGNRPGYAAVTCMMGCLIGVTFGILIESIGKWSQNIKTAILIGSSIFCAFLAGLMISSMKDIIEKHAPIVNRVNPAALIADSFYCICVYDDVERLQMNLVIMGVMSVLFLIVAWLMTRRVRYDSL